MTRQQLEHIIRASGAVADEKVILVLGSQSLLGSADNASDKLLVSIEADVFPIKAPDKTELINGSLGEITQFHKTFGYYAHAILPASCPLPKGWEKRLSTLKNENTNGITGLCISAADLACSKLAAGRPKDLDFLTEMLATGIVTPKGLGKLIADLPHANSRLAAQRSLEIVGHRVRPWEASLQQDPESRAKAQAIGLSRDDLSL
jgi:hypothetical protein